MNTNTNTDLQKNVFKTITQYLTGPDADMTYKMYRHCALLYSSGDYVFDPEVCLFPDYTPPDPKAVEVEEPDETTAADAETDSELEDGDIDADMPEDDDDNGKTARDNWVRMAADDGLSEHTRDLVAQYGFDNVGDTPADNVRLIEYFKPYIQALTIYWTALSLTPESDKTAVAYMPSTPSALIGFCSVIIGKYGDTFKLLDDEPTDGPKLNFGPTFTFLDTGKS